LITLLLTFFPPPPETRQISAPFLRRQFGRHRSGGGDWYGDSSAIGLRKSGRWRRPGCCPAAGVPSLSDPVLVRWCGRLEQRLGFLVRLGSRVVGPHLRLSSELSEEFPLGARSGFLLFPLPGTRASLELINPPVRSLPLLRFTDSTRRAVRRLGHCFPRYRSLTYLLLCLCPSDILDLLLSPSTRGGRRRAAMGFAIRRLLRRLYGTENFCLFPPPLMSLYASLPDTTIGQISVIPLTHA